VSFDQVCFTVDVEWAHPEVLAHVRRMFDDHGVPATFFCTHAGIDVGGHERALHPNFHRRGETMAAFERTCAAATATDDAAAHEYVVRTTKAFCPEAVGTRSHSLFHHADLLPVFARHDLEYDSTYFLPLAPGLKPMDGGHGIVELPIYFMDYYDLAHRRTDFRARRLGLERPGLKVLDFHPNLVFINATSRAHYESTRPFYGDCERLAAARFSQRGVGTLLREALELVADRSLPTATLGSINRAWRAAA
jgi:hypothetical protein